MAARALSEAAMREALVDIRLPPDAAGGLPGEILAAAALGLAAALALSLVLRLSSRAAAPDGDTPPATGASPCADDRALAALHRLRTVRPEVVAAWRDRLYRPGAGPELAEIEAALEAAEPPR